MTPLLEYDIYQGDTGPILRPRPTSLGDGVTLDGAWSCYSAVMDYDGNNVVTAREITDKTGDGLRWVAALTPTETALLTVPDGSEYKPFYWVLEVRNPSATPPFNVEKHIVLKVKRQGIEP